MKHALKLFFRILAIVLGVILVLGIGLFAFLTITEYRPEAVESIGVETASTPKAAFSGSTVRLLSWNVGYCALGKDSDFFMDGGTSSRPGSEETVRASMDGIRQTILSLEEAPDFILMQEVDSGSKRSFWQQQVEYFRTIESYPASAYAYNYKCEYVPIPFPPLGKVQSGLLTLSVYAVTEAERIALPCPFSWPVSTANLKRCLLVTRVPIEGSDKELVIVNLHLEAYDDGEGKIAQTNQLLEFLTDEYQKGNYVVAGGDWNQLFPGTEAVYPNTHAELWTPGVLLEDQLPAGWSFVWDDATPTCRLLNQPYRPEDTANTQYYVIDGFLISPNLRVSEVQTLDQGFTWSDHNPVLLELELLD